MLQIILLLVVAGLTTKHTHDNHNSTRIIITLSLSLVSLNISLPQQNRGSGTGVENYQIVWSPRLWLGRTCPIVILSNKMLHQVSVLRQLRHCQIGHGSLAPSVGHSSVSGIGCFGPWVETTVLINFDICYNFTNF